MQYLPELLIASSQYLMDSAEIKHVLLSIIIAQWLNIITYIYTVLKGRNFHLTLSISCSILIFYGHCMLLLVWNKQVAESDGKK